MRHPRHPRSQVWAHLKETLDMEARNMQCSTTALASLLAFDVNCGIPGKVRRVVFSDDRTAAVDHAFLYVHIGIHLFCLSTRVHGILQALQRSQTIDAEGLLSGTKGTPEYAPTLSPPRPLFQPPASRSSENVTLASYGAAACASAPAPTGGAPGSQLWALLLR